MSLEKLYMERVETDLSRFYIGEKQEYAVGKLAYGLWRGNGLWGEYIRRVNNVIKRVENGVYVYYNIIPLVSFPQKQQHATV